MGSISNAKAVYGLSASGAPTKTNVNGSSLIGVSLGTAIFTDADVAYSFTVTSTGASDVAALTVRSGVCGAVTDTPTITDGDGNDFEGVAIVTLATVSSIMIVADEVGTSFITISSALSGAPSANLLGDGQVMQSIYPAPITVAAETLSILFTEIGQQVTITVVGSTT